MVLLQRKLYFSKDPEGVPTFSRGSKLFPGGGGGGGVQMLISIETHITCDFPGGPDPLSPLWILTCGAHACLTVILSPCSRFSYHTF